MITEALYTSGQVVGGGSQRSLRLFLKEFVDDWIAIRDTFSDINEVAVERFEYFDDGAYRVTPP